MSIYSSERGNILFIILLAVVLIGTLTAVISSGNTPAKNIDQETIILRAGEVQRYAAALEQGVRLIIQNGISESEIRFAHPRAHADYGDITTTPQHQIFAASGGGIQYLEPPEDVNNGSAWEFYAGTAAPGVGTSKADLMAVLPNVTQEFCDYINSTVNQTSSPQDTGATVASGSNPGECVHIGALGRFDNGQQFYDTPNTMNEASFAQDPNISAAYPAPQGCVRCTIGNANHFYSVLIAR